MAKKKKIPERKCVITNEMKPKKELIRIVRNKEGEVFVDETGKKNGRGAYLSKDKSVIEQARKTNALNKTLNAEVSPTIYDELEALVEGE
ncbi:RNase P modulator RnpM [Oceanobacillus jeddahense]|uniref:YlxR family protein n=1 Tax=Oceanobacillus jeddahense TaxID=1462527 RepID=A0ABY5JMH0_9BACI|nr:YlxR family protein [Oceanobacillus jeddahense]UUI01506.1 YlxR family protein [Oceanobacillus jeddahense]